MRFGRSLRAAQPPPLFSLPADQVDLLIESGAEALRLSKSYQAFRRGR
jgi:NTE family protein